MNSPLTSKEEVRKAFHRWARQWTAFMNTLHLQSPQGVYLDEKTDLAWNAFQAGRASDETKAELAEHSAHKLIKHHGFAPVATDGPLGRLVRDAFHMGVVSGCLQASKISREETSDCVRCAFPLPPLSQWSGPACPACTAVAEDVHLLGTGYAMHTAEGVTRIDPTTITFSSKASECLCARRNGQIVETHLVCPIHGLKAKPTLRDCICVALPNMPNPMCPLHGSVQNGESAREGKL